HRSNFLFLEADRLSAARAKNDLAAPIGDRDANQPIIVPQVHCDDAVAAWTREGGERCFLDRALARRHEDEMILVVLFDGEERVDLSALLEWQEAHHGLAARAAACQRQLIDLDPIDLAAVREAQDRVMRVRDEQLLDEILIVDGRRGLSTATAALCVILSER